MLHWKENPHLCTISPYVPGPPFQVRIHPPDTNQYLVGQDITFLCEVPQGSPYGRPQWRGPDGAPIVAITQGRYFCILFASVVQQKLS